MPGPAERAVDDRAGRSGTLRKERVKHLTDHDRVVAGGIVGGSRDRRRHEHLLDVGRWALRVERSNPNVQLSTPNVQLSIGGRAYKHLPHWLHYPSCRQRNEAPPQNRTVHDPATRIAAPSMRRFCDETIVLMRSPGPMTSMSLAREIALGTDGRAPRHLRPCVWVKIRFNDVPTSCRAGLKPAEI